MRSDRIESVSKPQLLRTALMETLQLGKLRVGDRLPSEPELIAKYGVSRATVREALVALEQDGWVRRVQGKGTFVSERPKVHRTIAVIAPYLYANDSPDFRAGTDVIPILMQSLEHQARKHGVSIMLYLDNWEPETERENMMNVIDRGVDALLMIYIGGRANLDCLERVKAAGIPVVLLDRYIEELPIGSVASDNYLGAHRAVQQFVEAGFQSVTYITAPIDSTALRDRLRGYETAMRERGFKPDVRELVQGIGEGIDRANYDLTRDLVEALEFPSAIFCCDATRFALVSEQILNRDVPHRDLALGCFDEPYLSFPDDVLVVKVLQPLREIARMSVDLILGLLDGAVDAKAVDSTRILLPPEVLRMGAASSS